MAKTSVNQIRAVSKYQSKMKRFTMLFSIKEYNTIMKYIYPLPLSTYIRNLIREDITRRRQASTDARYIKEKS